MPTMTTRTIPVLTELVDNPDGDGKLRREWFCKPPAEGARFTIIRSEQAFDLDTSMLVQRIREIKILITCSGPDCGNQVVSPRRRFCSDRCARRARRAEKNVENPEFGLAALRMIRAMSRRVGASDIDTFGMLWDLRKQVEAATVEAVGLLLGKGFTYQRISEEIGVSRKAISQWHHRHLAKLEQAAGLEQEAEPAGTLSSALPSCQRAGRSASYTGFMYLSLDALRVDTPAHVIAAWALVHSAEVTRIVKPGEIAVAKDRIQYAAVEHGLGFLPAPEE
jgi:hypothetical protein